MLPGERKSLRSGRQPETSQSQLNQEDGGQAVTKMLMERFVAEGMHTQYRARTAAQQGGEEECPLRNAPPVLPDPALVRTEEEKGRGIDEKKPAGKK